MARFETTSMMRVALNEYVAMRDALPKLLGPRYWWQRSVSVDEQIAFLKALSAALSALQTLAIQTYPDLRCIGAWTANTSFILSDEEPQSVDAVDPQATSTGKPSTRD